MDITTELPASTVDTAGFPKPPVVAVEANLAMLVKPWTVPATPPPTITASPHFKNGVISETAEAITIVPATVAAGTAIVSRRLSTHGM